MKAFSFTRFLRLLVRILEISLLVALAFRWFVYFGGSYGAPFDGAPVDVAFYFSFLAAALLVVVSVGLLVTRQPRSGVTALRTLIYIIVFLLTPFRLGRIAALDSVPRPNHAMERTATRRVFPFSVVTIFSLRSALALGGRRSSYSR